MKFFVTPFFVCFCLLSFSQGIRFFEGTLEQAKAEAASKNKFIFIDCYTTWCGPCKWLAKNVFTNDNVGIFYNQNFVNYTIDMEKGEGKDFAKKYGIHAYPTLLFIDSKGNVQHRYVGACDTITFLAIGKQALDTANNFGSMLRKYQQGNRQPDFLAKYALTCASVYYPYDINEYFATQPDTALIREINLQIMERYQPNVSSREYNYVLKNFDLFVAKYGFNRIFAYLTNSTSKTLYALSMQKDFNAEKEIDKILPDNKTSYNDFWKASFLMEFYGYYKVKRYAEYVQQAKIFINQAKLSTPYTQSCLLLLLENFKTRVTDENLNKEMLSFLKSYQTELTSQQNSESFINIAYICARAKEKETASNWVKRLNPDTLSETHKKEYDELLKLIQSL